MRRVKNEQEHLVKVCMQTNAVQVVEMAKLLRMEKLTFNKKLRNNSLTLRDYDIRKILRPKYLENY